MRIHWAEIPDGISNNAELCTWSARGDGLISAAPRRLHQTLPDFIHLPNQEGFWSVTVVTVQIHL